MKIQVHINKTSVSIKDRGFNYGDGLFETILVKNKKALYLSDHIKRLIRGCKVLKIPTPSIKLVENSIKQSISRTKECIIKIIYTRGLSDHGYGYDKNIIPQLYVIKKRKSHSKIKKTISLGYSKYFLNDNSSLSKIKHMNRLEQILGATFKPKKIYDNYILLFFALLGLFLIIKEFINDIKSGFISLGCFILTMTMSLILGPKAGSDYFVKKILNELIKLEESEKKVNQENAKLLRKSIDKIKKNFL